MSAPDGAREVGPVWCDVLGAVFVSTVYRESSAMEYRSPYFETMAFPVEGKPAILWQSAAGFEREARRQHDLAVRWFSRATESRSLPVAGVKEEQ